MIIIKNGNVLQKNGEFKTCDIALEGNKIKEVASTIQSKEEDEVIDAGGKLVTPGLIDAHCHLGMWEDSIGFEGDDGNELTDPITPQLRAIDAINPMDGYFKDALEGGVTTVATGPGSANAMGGQFAAIKTYGTRIDNMILREPLAMKIAFGENPKRFYGTREKMPRTRMAIAALLRDTLSKAKEYYEKKKNGKDVDFNLQYEALIPVMEHKIPLKAHAHRADDVFTAIRIAKEFGLKLTLDHCTEGHLIADELAKEGYAAIIGPTFGDRPKVELKNKSFETPGVLVKAGMKIAIMTDSPVIPLENLSLCAAWAYKSGLDYQEAWKTITINPAEILGIEDRVGSIEEGKDADIIIWEGDPLKEIQAMVQQTIINGEIVYKK